ncbi:hypothetical protein [Archangium lansingense]|uniref:Uncharacterized protein n=1 Tax=Archangium lansingense TaxID=2995310 RepID=A0ABT4AP00_9BACT|nr:hypothetical protein [Archangium lansinium]MCY1083438.1 hypothetical protein [Archangium lansinium]
MNNESNWLDTVKNLVAEKQTMQTPSVTCGSSAERKWWPPHVVETKNEKKKK